MGMRLPAYNAPAKKSIEISLPWHSSTIPISDMNQDIVRGKFNKSLKPQNPSKPWGPKDFFRGSGYYVHNTQGYLAKPDSLVVPSRLSNFVEGWKRITNDPYVLSIVAKGYRLRFTSPPLLR